MKILHVNKTYFPESTGGIEESIRQLCKNSKHEYKIFCASHDGICEQALYEGVEVIRVPSFSGSKAMPINLSGVLKFKKLVNWADIVHIHFPWPNADLFSLFCSNKRTKFVVTYHSDIVRSKLLLALYKPIMKSFFAKVERLVATSPNYYESSETLQNYKDKVEVVPLGLVDFSEDKIDQREQKSLLAKINKPFFLFLGVPRKYKGLKYLIDATKKLKQSHTVVVAGDGGFKKNCVEYAESVGSQNIKFLGHVSSEEKAILLKNCVAVILPSTLRSEAFGLTLVEGAMFGKPLICTEIGSGMSYINQHQKTGIVVKPSNSKELAEAMDFYVDSPASVILHGKASRERYEELFEVSKMLNSYDQLYKKVLQK